MNVIRTCVIQKVFLLVFTIFIFMQNKGQNETKVKLITITYWIKLLLVTRVWGKNHVIYECITIWCVFELVHPSLLIAYLLKDLWDTIFIVYLSFRRHNWSTSFQLHIQWFSNVVAYATCHMSNLRLLLCCALICTGFIGVDVRRSGCHADGYRERGAVMGCSFHAANWARLRDVASSSLGAVASALWFPGCLSSMSV